MVWFVGLYRLWEGQGKWDARHGWLVVLVKSRNKKKDHAMFNLETEVSVEFQG